MLEHAVTNGPICVHMSIVIDDLNDSMRDLGMQQRFHSFVSQCNVTHRQQSGGKFSVIKCVTNEVLSLVVNMLFCGGSSEIRLESLYQRDPHPSP